MLGTGCTKSIYRNWWNGKIFFPVDKIMVTGNPVRNSILNRNINKEEAAQHFSLENNKTTLLMVGGSLGAKSINDAALAHLDELLDAGLQLIWQTGKSFDKEALAKVATHKNVWINEFITKDGICIFSCRYCDSKTGAMTVAEICNPETNFFVPYPLQPKIIKR